MASLESGDRGAGSGMLNTSRQLGFLLGVAILVAVFGHTMHTSVVAAAEKARTVINAQPLLSKELKHYIDLGIDQAEKVNATATITDLRKIVHPLNGVPLPPVNAAEALVLLNLRDRLETIFVDDVAAGFFWPFMTAAIAALFSAAPAVLLVRRLPGPRRPASSCCLAASQRTGVRRQETSVRGSPIVPPDARVHGEAGRGPTAAGRPPAAASAASNRVEVVLGLEVAGREVHGDRRADERSDPRPHGDVVRLSGRPAWPRISENVSMPSTKCRHPGAQLRHRADQLVALQLPGQLLRQRARRRPAAWRCGWPASEGRPAAPPRRRRTSAGRWGRRAPRLPWSGSSGRRCSARPRRPPLSARPWWRRSPARGRAATRAAGWPPASWPSCAPAGPERGLICLR